MNISLVPDPRDLLAVVHQHGERLRFEAAAERLCGPPAGRRVVAAVLRGLAERLDPTPLAIRSALR